MPIQLFDEMMQLFDEATTGMLDDLALLSIEYEFPEVRDYYDSSKKEKSYMALPALDDGIELEERKRDRPAAPAEHVYFLLFIYLYFENNYFL